jgi:hypothetical protein
MIVLNKTCAASEDTMTEGRGGPRYQTVLW